MEAAAFVALALEIGLASSMSVLFGWQPMPGDTSEGGPRIEYIVQLEPELVATLKAGQSIPITSDIPDDIGPIGRIRIVVGREALPRQKLATRFKPWPKQPLPGKQSQAGLVETQFTAPAGETNGSGRYGRAAATAPSAGNAILPPGGGNSAVGNPLARALQQSAQEARNLATDATQQILPPAADQLFGAGGGSSQGVRNAIGNGADQLQRGFQQGIEPVADQTGKQLSQAVGNIRQRAGESLGQFSFPKSSERSQIGNNVGANGRGESTAVILPPNSTPPGQANNGHFNPKVDPKVNLKGRRIDQPVQRRQPDLWQPKRNQSDGSPPASFAADSSPVQTNPSSQPGVFNAPWPATTGNSAADTRGTGPPPNHYPVASGQPPAQPSAWSRNPASGSPFDVANRTTDEHTPRYGDNRQTAYTSTNGTSTNGTSTNGTSTNGTSTNGTSTNGDSTNRNLANGSPTNAGLDGPRFSKTGPQQHNQQIDDSNWASQPGPPAITRDMLPALENGSLHTANDDQRYQGQPTARQTLKTQSSDFGYFQADAANNDGTEPQNGTTLFPLLLSWVLLTGSGAGNAYLWWSYLDVRNKYRGVVHGAPRRHERYDD